MGYRGCGGRREERFVKGVVFFLLWIKKKTEDSERREAKKVGRERESERNIYVSLSLSFSGG